MPTCPPTARPACSRAPARPARPSLPARPVPAPQLGLTPRRPSDRPRAGPTPSTPAAPGLVPDCPPAAAGPAGLDRDCPALLSTELARPAAAGGLAPTGHRPGPDSRLTGGPVAAAGRISRARSGPKSGLRPGPGLTAPGPTARRAWLGPGPPGPDFKFPVRCGPAAAREPAGPGPGPPTVTAGRRADSTFAQTRRLSRAWAPGHPMIAACPDSDGPPG
jgi:hypothetical protein